MLRAKLKRGAELVAALLFAAMFGAFIIQVVSRYVFDAPVSWSLEICSITYVWIVFLVSATILTPRQHITFDMLYGAVSPRWKRRFAIFTSASVLAIFAICLPTTIGYVLFLLRHLHDRGHHRRGGSPQAAVWQGLAIRHLSLRIAT